MYLDLTAEDNLRLQARLLGLPSEEGIAPLLELVGLGETGRKKARNFSLGMRQRLGIAVALCGEPDFLVLDEPVNGLDPQGIIEMRELILKLNREYQITVLLSSHILDELGPPGHPLRFFRPGNCGPGGQRPGIGGCLPQVCPTDSHRCQDPLPGAGWPGAGVPSGRRGGGRRL